MENKRKAYSTSKAQVEANKRYLANNPEAKEKNKISTLRSSAKRFINNFATKEDLLILKEMIENKI